MKEKFSNQDTPPRRRRLKILGLVILVGIALYVIRLALGLGTAAWHYSNTPDFAEYLTSHPVQSETIEARLPSGEPITTESPWTTGSIDPLSLTPDDGEYERSDLTLLIDITRGDESLLSFEEEFSVALRRSDWTHHGVRIGVSNLRTAPGLRAIVVTSISDPEKMVGENSMGVGGAVVDLFLVSGAGPSESRFQFDPDGNVWSGGPGIVSTGVSFPIWRKITGIAHNTRALPAEGLIHHVRQRVSFDWKKYEGGHGGPSMSFVHHAVNTDEYSYGLKVEIEGSKGGHFKTEKNLSRTWNGEIW
jgi:hypothetical protein